LEHGEKIKIQAARNQLAIGSSDSHLNKIMNTAIAQIEAMATASTVAAESNKERFVVFVAGSKRPIISCSNYKRAERLAIIFAGLTKVRMEVFDSLKEMCYFVEPFEMSCPNVH